MRVLVVNSFPFLQINKQYKKILGIKKRDKLKWTIQSLRGLPNDLQ